MMPEHVPASSSDDTATRITAIETSYKGYRFRSRLEARWAVFFDHMKWSWKYEPQGYDIGGDRYLPDFWVEQIGWVEVKGELDRSSLLKLALAAGPEGLPWHFKEDSQTPAGTARWMGERDDELDATRRWSWLEVAVPICPRLILLGDIPDPALGWSHLEFGLSNGRHVVFRPFVFKTSGRIPIFDWSAVGADPWPGMPHGVGFGERRIDVGDAYRAARSARFEHGESGAV